jgi:thermostable 8-oxoguanine DNA glycosylase
MSQSLYTENDSAKSKGQKKGKIKTKIGSKQTSHFYRNADFKPLLTISKHNDKPIYKNDGFTTLVLKH